MNIIIKCTNIDLVPSIRAFIEQKVGSISKFIQFSDSGLAKARVEVGRPSKHHRTGFVYYAEINLKIGGHLFRGVAEHADLHTAIDFARNEVEHQLKKGKQKSREPRRVQRRI